MHRLWASVGATFLAAFVISGTALASPPSWAHGSGQPTQASAPSPENGPPQAQPFGHNVLGIVHSALGEHGTPLADAIHQLLSQEHTDARGLSVAESVYSRLQSDAAAPAGSPFTDLAQQAPWAEAAVGALQGAGVVDGTSATTFAPDQPVTLAELAAMLARLQAGSAPSGAAAPAGTPAWAQSALAWAQSDGLLAGEAGLGTPNAPLTRAQAVLMLINAAGLGQQAATQANAPLGLQGAPPPWAHGALALAIQLGLLQGSNGQLLANQPLTRAQMAVLLARLALLDSGGATGPAPATSPSAG